MIKWLHQLFCHHNYHILDVNEKATRINYWCPKCEHEYWTKEYDKDRIDRLEGLNLHPQALKIKRKYN